MIHKPVIAGSEHSATRPELLRKIRVHAPVCGPWYVCAIVQTGSVIRMIYCNVQLVRGSCQGGSPGDRDIVHLSALLTSSSIDWYIRLSSATVKLLGPGHFKMYGVSGGTQARQPAVQSIPTLTEQTVTANPCKTACLLSARCDREQEPTRLLTKCLKSACVGTEIYSGKQNVVCNDQKVISWIGVGKHLCREPQGKVSCLASNTHRSTRSWI